MKRLSWPFTRWVDLHICHRNLKSLYRGPNWVQSHILSRWSQQHVFEMAPYAETLGRAYISMTGQLRAFYCLGPACVLTGGQMLSMTSSNTYRDHLKRPNWDPLLPYYITSLALHFLPFATPSESNEAKGTGKTPWGTGFLCSYILE